MPDEQVLAWLKAKARVTDAEEQLSDMFDKTERLLRSLRDQPSTPFDPNSWPEGSAVAAPCENVVRRNTRSTKPTLRSAQRTASYWSLSLLISDATVQRR